MLGRVLVLTVLAGGLPALAAAETERAGVRPERLLQPLGAGGALDPLVKAANAVERQIAGRVHDPRPTLRDSLDALAIAKHDQAVRELAGGGAPIRLAALPRQAHEAVQSDLASALPWTRVPALPRPLTRGLVPAEPFEVKRLSPAFVVPAPRLARRPQGVRPWRSGLRLALFVSRAPRSVAPLGAMSFGDPDVGRPFSRFDPWAAPALDARPQVPRGLAPQFILPFEHGRISSLFNQGRAHPAIDLAGRLGAPVFATSDGQTVIFAGARGGYGNAVITRDGEGREHLYGHLSAIGTRVGVVLKQGDRLGALGSTGFSTGPHVHYEVKDRRGAHINPVTLLFPGRAVASGYAWGAVSLPDRSATASVR